MCNPCGRRFIFLIEAVPTESATLLHMLNMLPDVQLFGDSYGLLLSLHEAHHVSNYFSRKFAKFKFFIKISLIVLIDVSG